MDDRTYLLKKNNDLYEAALDVFSSVAFSEASLNDIIKRSHTNKGSFYYRFSNKEELYLALLEYVYVKQKECMGKAGRASDLRQLLDVMLRSLRKLHAVDPRFLLLYTRFYHEEPSFYEAMEDRSILSPLRQYEPYLKKMYVREHDDIHGYERFYSLFRLIYDNFHVFVEKEDVSNMHLIHHLLPGDEPEKHQIIHDDVSSAPDDLMKLLEPSDAHAPFLTVEWKKFIHVKKQYAELLKDAAMIGPSGYTYHFRAGSFHLRRGRGIFRFLKVRVYFRLFRNRHLMTRFEPCIETHPSYFSFFEQRIFRLSPRQRVLFSLIQVLGRGVKHVFIHDANTSLDRETLSVFADLTHVFSEKNEGDRHVFILDSRPSRQTL